MTLVRSCDYCGEAIGNDDGYVRLEVLGKDRRPLALDEGTSDVWTDGWLAHYHDDCMGTVRGLLCLIKETGPDLESVPTLPAEPTRAAVQVESSTAGASILPAERAEVMHCEGLTFRARRALREAGLLSFEDLAGVSAAEVSSVEGVGPAAMNALGSEMRARGLDFAEDTFDPRRLRELRLSAGWSQWEVARQFEPCISSNTVCAWENGRQVPMRAQRVFLAQLFGMTLAEFEVAS